MRSAVIGAIGLALATPQIKLAAGVLGKANTGDHTNVHGVAKSLDGEEDFNVSMEIEGPSTITTTMADHTAGGQNGWHSHPGMVIVTLTQGSIQWYDAACKLTVYNAGDSWMEGSQTHFLRVLGETTTQFVTTFTVAKGQVNRIDQPAPPCAAALGLN